VPCMQEGVKAMKDIKSLRMKYRKKTQGMTPSEEMEAIKKVCKEVVGFLPKVQAHKSDGRPVLTYVRASERLTEDGEPFFTEELLQELRTALQELDSGIEVVWQGRTTRGVSIIGTSSGLRPMGSFVVEPHPSGEGVTQEDWQKWHEDRPTIDNSVRERDQGRVLQLIDQIFAEKEFGDTLLVLADVLEEYGVDQRILSRLRSKPTNARESRMVWEVLSGLRGKWHSGRIASDIVPNAPRWVDRQYPRS